MFKENNTKNVWILTIENDNKQILNILAVFSSEDKYWKYKEELEKKQVLDGKTHFGFHKYHVE